MRELLSETYPGNDIRMLAYIILNKAWKNTRLSELAQYFDREEWWPQDLIDAKFIPKLEKRFKQHIDHEEEWQNCLDYFKKKREKAMKKFLEKKLKR